MSDTITWIRHLNRTVLDGLDAKEAAIVAREADARAALDACAVERANIKKLRDSVLEAENLQLSALKSGFEGGLSYGPELPRLRSEEVLPPERGEPNVSRKPRARVGTQRYLMLVALREANHLTHEGIEKWTGLSAKRVREQIKSDVEQGFVDEIDVDDEIAPSLGLTDEGLDLLNRFEEYKRRQGERLPTLADVREDGGDDNLAEDDLAQSGRSQDLDSDTAPPSVRQMAFN